jgi:heme/copper-type cytochrome/quinol oxidase subunit 2
MITKIILTLLVIVGAVIFLRMKQAENNPQPRPVKVERSENEKMFRQGAWLFLIFMVISALVVFSFKIGDRYETVSVHVVNIQTGERVTYQAEQQDIKSNKFTTVQGRTVYVADIERVEIEPN